MDNFEIKGDEVRHGKHIYLDAASQSVIDSFDDTLLSEKMLYRLNDGSRPITHISAKKIAESVKAQDGLVFALRLISDKSCIGFAHIGDINWQSRRSLLQITILSEAHFTLTYFADALQTVLQFAYWEANLNRIELQCLEDNETLCEALELVGFSKEGHLRQEAYRDGHYLDILMYSHLQREWSQ